MTEKGLGFQKNLDMLQNGEAPSLSDEATDKSVFGHNDRAPLHELTNDINSIKTCVLNSDRADPKSLTDPQAMDTEDKYGNIVMPSTGNESGTVASRRNASNTDSERCQLVNNHVAKSAVDSL